MSPKETLDRLCLNTVDVIDKDDFLLRLEESAKKKVPLRVKAGFDPSAPDIHLGHTVLLRKLRQFQDLGHKVVLSIGDFTAMIGDPTGQIKTRPALSQEEVKKNAKTYQDQAFKILDKDPKKIEIVRNNDWLGKLSLKTFLESLGSQYTVDQLLAREDFQKRQQENKPITICEFMYPLLQGYDSVVVKSDVELGGTDQKFNLLVGRQLQKSFGQKPQVVMTLPLLVGLDGTQKMSKSLGNYIAVNDTAKDVFGKAMSVPDALMAQYFNLLTDINGDEIQKKVSSGELHPRDAKVKLSRTLTGNFYDLHIADQVQIEFDRVFSKKETPEHPEELKVAEKEIWIVELVKRTGSATSTSGTLRLIKQGAVSIDGEKIADGTLKVSVKKGMLLKVGKKRFVKII